MSKLKSDLLKVKPKIVELQEANDIYMELTLCILTNQINLNKLEFTEDYINGIVENKDRFIGIPLVVNRSKLESGIGDLTHEFDPKTGKLNTDQVGSFVDFWSSSDEDGVIELMGLVRVQKRYASVCNALIDLYEADNLEFSCEIFAYGYANKNEETGVRSVDYKYEGYINSLIGSAVIDLPAEPKSTARLLVAEAYKKDIENNPNLKGGESMGVTPNTETFNKGKEIQYHGKLETSSLKWNEISNQIYNTLNPIDPKKDYRSYNYYICDLYNDHVIVEDYEDYSILYRIPYRIENDLVILDSQENWVKGYSGFIPEGISVDDLLAEKENITVEMNSNINDLKNQHKEELQTMSDENKTKETELQSNIEGLTVKVGELEVKINELNETIVSQQEIIGTHEEKETELNSIIEELTPFKTQVETSEKEAKQSKLTEKFSKLLSEDSMKSDEVKVAIEELNESKLNEIVVSEISKNKELQKDSAGDVIVNARVQEDLVPQSSKEKLYSARG